MTADRPSQIYFVHQANHLVRPTTPRGRRIVTYILRIPSAWYFSSWMETTSLANSSSRSCGAGGVRDLPARSARRWTQISSSELDRNQLDRAAIVRQVHDSDHFVVGPFSSAARDNEAACKFFFGLRRSVFSRFRHLF